MATVKKKAHENLTTESINEVIAQLASDSPITKKEACDFLNIRYNTTRLQKIIDEHNEVWEFREKRKSQNRGKGATREEIKSVIKMYLEGDNVSEISTGLYRSNAFVKAIIERVGIPEKLPAGFSRTTDIMLPEPCVAESFEEGEKVWSARDNGIATIKKEHSLEYQASRPGLTHMDYEAKYGAKGYAIYVHTPCDTSKTLFPWLEGKNMGHNSFSIAYDLGSLKHLEQYGVNI
jgi:hypothetical protein|tara:strand:- start:231 stop:932 length:702 start_codon:yes stop_codon:yes gene_type:complete